MIVTGIDDGVAEAFAALPFDHLMFTGSTRVGRMVAAAAGRNLTPVTLELGGKSPAIVDRSADLDEAAPRIAYAKLLNAGQTCIAPDYVLVPPGSVEDLAGKIRDAMQRMYGTDPGQRGLHLDRLRPPLRAARRAWSTTPWRAARGCCSPPRPDDAAWQSRSASFRRPSCSVPRPT